MVSPSLVKLVNSARAAIKDVEQHLAANREDPSARGASAEDLLEAARQARRWTEELHELATCSAAKVDISQIVHPRAEYVHVTYGELTKGHPAFEDVSGRRYMLDASGNRTELPRL